MTNAGQEMQIDNTEPEHDARENSQVAALSSLVKVPGNDTDKILRKGDLVRVAERYVASVAFSCGAVYKYVEDDNSGLKQLALLLLLLLQEKIWGQESGWRFGSYTSFHSNCAISRSRQ